LKVVGPALLLLAFAGLGIAAARGLTAGFDEAVLHAALALRSADPWLGETMRDFSGLGSLAVLSLCTLIAAGWLLLTRRRAGAVVLVLSVPTARVTVGALKGVFGRVRPDPAFAFLPQDGLAYPSIHACMSAFVFLSIGALLTQPAGGRARGWLLGSCGVLAFIVGCSRVVLGVHWATDVLAGWALGAAWATGWLLVAHRVMRSEMTDAGQGRRG